MHIAIVFAVQPPYLVSDNIVFVMQIVRYDFQRFADIFHIENHASRQYRVVSCAVNVSAYVLKALMFCVPTYLHCLQFWSSIHLSQ